MSETAEQKATRRRWLTLAEFVAVAGVLIGALTLWLNWSDRRQDKAEAAATAAAAAKDKARFELKGVVASGNKSVMLARDDDHELGDVRVDFPTELGVPPQDAVGHEIESDWFEKPILKLTDGGADDRTGRLPVLVTYQYSSGDEMLTGRAIHTIVWDTSGRFLRGRSLAITGFRVRERGGDQRRLDAIWKREKP